jgi:hypothetical protein
MILVRPADWEQYGFVNLLPEGLASPTPGTQKHRPRWRHLQVPEEKQLESGRKSTDMDLVRNPVEEVGSFFKMQRNSHHIKTLDITHKGNKQPHSNLMK